MRDTETTESKVTHFGSFQFLQHRMQPAMTYSHQGVREGRMTPPHLRANNSRTGREGSTDHRKMKNPFCNLHELSLEEVRQMGDLHELQRLWTHINELQLVLLPFS